jgi:regulator of sigma D
MKMKTISIFNILVIEFDKLTGIEAKYMLEKTFNNYDKALEYIEKTLPDYFKSNDFTSYNFDII